MDKNNLLGLSAEILENIDEGFLALSRDWSIIYINNRAASSLGLRPEDLIDQNFWKALPMMVGSEQEIYYRKAMQESEQIEFETRKTLNNKWCKIRVHPFTEGLFVYWQNTNERKLFEETFKRNLESFKETQALARIGFWEYNLKTHKMTWSVEVYVLFERDQQLGPPSSEEEANYYSSDQLKSLRDNMEHAIRTGQTTSFDLEVKLPSGKSAYLHSTISPMKDAQDRVARLHGIVQDITERKQVEEKLKESEEKYRNLVEVTSDFIWEVDKDGIYTYVSPKIVDILGYEPEEVLGKTPFDVMPPGESERIRKIFQDYVFLKKSFNSLENINRHKDGRLIVIETSGVPYYGNKGELRGYRGVDREITQRKKAEAALAKAKDELEIKVRERTADLAESEEKYRLLVENASEFIAVAQDGLIKFTNKKGLEMTGCSKEEITNKPLLDLVHPDDLELVKGNYRKHIASEDAPSSYEFRYVPKDASIRWAHISTVKINWNRRPAILAIFTDITEYKMIEQQLKFYTRRFAAAPEEESK